METDFSSVVTSMKKLKNMSPRVIVYCRTLDICADLYAHFHFKLGDRSYYPPGAEKMSDNRFFGMFHVKHNEEVISSNLNRSDGVVRVVFATVAMGMCINLRDIKHHHTLWTTSMHRGLLSREWKGGGGGRSGDPA